MMFEHRNNGGENGSAAIGALRAAWRRVSVTLRARARLRRQQTARARSEQLKYIAREQLVYADVLEFGLQVGGYLLAILFALYVFGIITPKVPLDELSANWSLPAEEYSRRVGVSAGWGWIRQVHYGDYMNFLGIAFLASVTVACYARLLPVALRRRDYPFGAILLLEINVLLLAASGFLAIGH